jgi:hypothetical protein
MSPLVVRLSLWLAPTHGWSLHFQSLMKLNVALMRALTTIKSYRAR